MTPATPAKPDPVRAVCLFSGGLDSQLAVRVLQEQGIEAQAVAFRSVFFGAAAAEAAARRLNLPLLVEEFTPTIVALVRHPPHGFGAGLNPCIDCHLAMIRRAGELMRERGAHVVATGEVLNQRPMSQTRKALELITRESGCADRLLRPLSAKLLPETEPERLGWVDRERLCAFEGRSRRAQQALAEKLGVTNYPQPAGGCLLTDPGYARRLRDLKEHEGLDDIEGIARLRLGRHFRVGRARLIIGRDERENAALAARVRPSEVFLRVASCPGPVGLLAGEATEADLQQAAGLCAHYANSLPGQPVAIEVRAAGRSWTVETLPSDPDPFRVKPG